MSIIKFTTLVDLPASATPSSGFTLAYDLDGVLKQKDQLGVITPIGSLGTQTLEQVLNYGNQTGTFSIIVGTSSSLGSANGGGQILFDYNNPSTIQISTDYGLGNESYIILATNSSLIYSIGNSTFSANNLMLFGSVSSILQSTNYNSVRTVDILNNTSEIDMYPDSLSIGLSDTGVVYSNDTESITIYNTSTQSRSNTTNAKWPTLISSRGSSVNSAVINSVVIGGSFLTASLSNTVYLGNSVNINNAYTLPSTDGSNGYVLTTDGAGNVTWAAGSANQTLENVLSFGETTGPYNILIATGSVVKGEFNQNSILFDNSGLVLTTNGLLTNTYIQLNNGYATFSTSTFSISISDSLITTTNNQGLKYSSDYTATFVTQSLVSKGYVDNIIKSLDSYNTAYVDSTYGSNVSGQINKFDKPYQTIAGAINGLTSSVSSGYVHIRRGTYTETVYIQNGFNYYCEPGVVFTDGGFRDTVASTSKILGYAKFEGTSPTLIPLFLIFGSTVDFEFDSCNNRNYFARITNSVARIKANYIYSRGDNGHCFSIRGTSSVTINVTEKILCPYKTISISDSFSGDLYVDCPDIESDADLGFFGYLADTSVGLFTDFNTTGTIEIKGNISNTSSDNVYTIFLPDYNTRYDSSVAILGGNVQIEGKIDGRFTKGLYIGGTVSTGQIKVKGDIFSYRESVVLNTNLIPTYLSEGTLESFGSGSFPYVMSILGTSSRVYSKGTILFNRRNNSSIVYTSSTQSTIGFYDTLGFSNGTTGDFVYTTQSVSIGFHSVRSNKDNNILVTDLFGPSGFIYDTGLFIPNF